MLGSNAVRAIRQFSTTVVKNGHHAYQGPGYVSFCNNKKNVIYITDIYLILVIMLYSITIFVLVYRY